MNLKAYISIFLILLFLTVEKGRGQTMISGVINDYTKVTFVAPGCNSLTVSGVTGFGNNDKVLIIQMKGALMDSTTNGVAFGNILNLGDAGNYEFNEILTIIGNTVYLKYTLQRTYTPSFGFVQLVRIPQYSDVTINGTLTAQAWDNATGTGGVLVFEASGTVTFGADINVAGKGFAGGTPNVGAGTACSGLVNMGYSAANTSNVNAGKGDGITSLLPARINGRGKKINGGGGGHSNNCGGGGGANSGSGGLGGRNAMACTQTGGQGIGGAALTYSNAANRIFLGGGGGAGHQNNLIMPGPPSAPGATRGNNGGGIVIIRANTIDGSSFKILAHGEEKNIKSFGDGAGGGGGGGAVLLSIGNYLSALTINASGSHGDSVYSEVVDQNLGPGGGGGGGVVWVSDPVINPILTTNVSGGVNGISWDPVVENHSCFCARNSSSGTAGSLLTSLVIPQSANIFTPPCVTVPVELISFTGRESSGKNILSWTTASEKNNDHFLLQKSYDGSSYENIGTIKGHGNSVTMNSYSFTDYAPFAGDNYYRLIQIDYSGLVQTVGHVHIRFQGAGELIGKIYPIPFNDELIVEATADFDVNTTKVSITTLQGADLGTISYKNEGSRIICQLSGLAPGVYLLHVSTASGTEVRKITRMY